MAAIESRVSKLEAATSQRARMVCLLKHNNESDDDCIQRHGYNDKPWVSVVLLNEFDRKL